MICSAETKLMVLMELRGLIDPGLAWLGVREARLREPCLA